MPYIEPALRLKYMAIRQGFQALGNLPAGDANYILTQFIRTFPKSRYEELERIIGRLELVKLEYWRRVVVPYEDEKCRSNGDVYCVDRLPDEVNANG